MSATEAPLNNSLVNWSNISADFTRSSFTGSGKPALLMGNGASRAIWGGFAYDSLLKEAQKLDSRRGLRTKDGYLFTAYNTANFEGILEALSTTQKVLKTLKKPRWQIGAQYNRIRTALVNSVHSVHISYDKVEPQLATIKDELTNYHYVFTTNYDLISYWAMMVEPEKFADYFWGNENSFDLASVQTWAPTQFFFLHGALHLYKNDAGQTCKLVEGWS